VSFTRGNLLANKDGGEGLIYEVQRRSDLLIKVYKEKNKEGKSIVTPELECKLEYMRANQPKPPLDHGVLAWPVDLVYEQRKLIGFVMPKLNFDVSILDVYAYKHPKFDDKDYANLPYVETRLLVAINLARTVHELHKAGYVVGDLNHENIGINKKNNAQVVIVDCDSFHIIDNSGKVMRANVVMPGYLAPEIIAYCHSERKKGNRYNLDEVEINIASKKTTFTKQSDLFCLAVHIFSSLMNGTPPFLGVQDRATGSAAAPFIGNEGIERNNYVFKSGLHPSAEFCIASNEIPQELVSMFYRAFVNGNDNPSKRPTAEEWYNALIRYSGMLKQCQNNKKHQYYNALNYCPYCEADKRWEISQTPRPKLPPIPPQPPQPPQKFPVIFDEKRVRVYVNGRQISSGTEVLYGTSVEYEARWFWEKY
jgi:DNA-binding helix-hairpin-helix protein with protein kinase domain